MKRTMILGCAFSFLLCALPVAVMPIASAASTGSTGSTNSVQMPNPLIDCDTLDAAADIAGFSFAVPDDINNAYTSQNIVAIENDMIQVILSNDDNNKLTIRKGSGTDDISGDYNNYKRTKTVNISGITVSLKGDATKFSLATWTDGTYSYSVSITENAQGSTQKKLQNIASSLLNANLDETPLIGDNSTNPFTQVSTMTEAKENIGFDMTVPKTVSTTYPKQLIQVAPSMSMIEVSYYRGTVDQADVGVTIRKAKSQDDISGDYNEYKTTKRFKLGNLIVTVKGNNGKYNLATWTNGSYSYSVYYKTAVSQKTIFQTVKGTR